MLSYSFGTIDWMQEDLNNLDVMTRKMIHAHKLMYKKQSVARIHAARENGGMGIPLIYTIYKSEIIGIKRYLEGKEDKFLKWVQCYERTKPSSKSITKKSDDYI